MQAQNESGRQEIGVEKLEAAFARALVAAQEFEGATAPNPPVGCVILDAQGRELAVAAHQKAGQPHAEALAIQKCREAGTGDRIHTLIVTLEPCNHHGRTPPCCDAILSTPAKHIWIGTVDPNPTVQGKGADRLQAAGLDVKFWPDREMANRLIAPFAKLRSTGLPFVTVKQALSRDGSMIPPAGQKTFTSQSSLVLAHKLRKRADAILTGSGTVLADASLFNVRHVPDFPGKRRKLVLLDRRQRVSDSYRVGARGRGFDVVSAQSIEQALEIMGAVGALELLVEAGPQLTHSILASKLWDEHVIIQETAGEDEISILENTDKGSHVLRHH